MKRVKVILMLLGALALAGAVAFWLFGRPLLQFAEIGTAYGAKKVCSCVFVAERDLESCKVDFTEDLSNISFTLERSGVRAEVLGGRYVERAVFNAGQGCRLVPIPG